MNTLVKDMVSTIEQDELVPSLSVPFLLCGMDEEEEGLEVLGSIEYIPEPFSKLELQPYGCHDILST